MTVALRTTTAASPETSGEPAQRLRTAVQALLVAVIDRAAGAALRAVDDLAETLEGITARGGAGWAAALGAGRALLAGGSPLPAALRAGFGALGPLGKTLAIAGLVASPVLLLLLVALLLVAVLVAAIVLLIRAATR